MRKRKTMEETKPIDAADKVKKKKMKRWKKILLLILIPVFLLTALQITYNCVVDYIFYKATEALLSSSDAKESISLGQNTTSATEVAPEDEEGQDSGGGETGETGKKEDILDIAAKKHNVATKLSFTPETIQKLNDKIPRSEKLAVLAIIARAIPQDTYQTLLSMTNGGITREEIRKAYSILSKNLSAEEKSKIYSYYSKYAYLLEE